MTGAKLLVLALDNLDRVRQLARMLGGSEELPAPVQEVIARLEESATMLDETAREAVIAVGAHINHPALKAKLAEQRAATLERARKRLQREG